MQCKKAIQTKIKGNEHIYAFFLATVLFIGSNMVIYWVFEFQYKWLSTFILFLVSFGIGFIVLNAMADKDIKQLFGYTDKVEEEVSQQIIEGIKEEK